MPYFHRAKERNVRCGSVAAAVPLVGAIATALVMAGCGMQSSSFGRADEPLIAETQYRQAPAKSYVSTRAAPAVSGEVIIVSDENSAAGVDQRAEVVATYSPAEPTAAAQPPAEAPVVVSGAMPNAAPIEVSDGRYVETGDLAAIRGHQQLRIALNSADNFNHATTENWQTETAIDFAIRLGLQPILIEMPQVSEALLLLESGIIDLIATDVTVTKRRKKRFAFSRSISHTRHQAIVRASDSRLKNPADLAGRAVSVNPDTPFYGTVAKLQRSWPSIAIIADRSPFDD